MAENGSAVAVKQDPREVALLKAIGFDRLAPEQRELALNIAQRYELDVMLKHLVMVDGKPYITRDGLLHVAHRSGNLDGIETTEPVIVDKFWTARCSVYRKDMSRPFTYGGRYPVDGQNRKFAPEMAIKVAEVMALRRAFDVAAPAMEERWDLDQTPVESASAAAPSLAERAAARAAEVVDAIAPSGALTKREFAAALRKNDIPSEVVDTVSYEFWPDPAYELTDADRHRLLDELLKGLDSDPPAGQETAPEDAPSPGQVAAFDEDAVLDAVAEKALA